MRKPVFYYFAGVLSVIAVLGVLWGCGLILENAFDFGGGGSDYNVMSTSPSPDGKHVATVYTGMGGGAAGWCSIRVTVNPASEPFSIEREKDEGKYVVFNISCGSEVETKWEDERNLLITYKGSNSDSGFSVYKSPVDWSKEIRIRYVERQSDPVKGAHNNGMHPTALSVPLINPVSCDAGCVVTAGGA